MSTDVTGSLDTTGVVGNLGSASYSQDSASTRDTTPTGGAGGGDNNKPATQPDTQAADGGDMQDDDFVNVDVTGTLDTQRSGSVTDTVDPDYRDPVDYDQNATNANTDHTDQPISDGSDPDETTSYQSGTLDTINFVQHPTVGTQTPATPGGAPTVVSGPRGVTVTFAHVADPTDEILGYVIEGGTGGTDFAGKEDTSVFVGNLTPGQGYKFRYAARNANGLGAFSALSAEVKPYNPDVPDISNQITKGTANVGVGDPNIPAGIPTENRQNPIYKPDGTTKAGTGSTVTSLVVVEAAAAGSVKATWVAPAVGGAVNHYVVTVYRASDGAQLAQDAAVSGAALTKTFTGLANALAVRVKVQPFATAAATSGGVAKTATGTTQIAQATFTSITPVSGLAAGGTAVTIVGNGLTGCTGGTLGGVALTSFVVVDDEHITAVTGAHAAGAVALVLSGGAGTASFSSAAAYTYV